MYSPQQLYQFIQYAKNYLELQDVQFKNGDNIIDPNNEEDVTKLISIALAEHRDGDKPSGFAQTYLVTKVGQEDHGRFMEAHGKVYCVSMMYLILLKILMMH